MREYLLKYPFAVIVVLIIPFLFVSGFEFLRFSSLLLLIFAYSLYVYRHSDNNEHTEKTLDLTSAVVGIVAAFFAVIDYKVVSFDRDLSELSAKVDVKLSWIILNLQDFDEFCIQCIQSRNSRQCEDYYDTSANRVTLLDDPLFKQFDHSMHVEQCNRYKHFRLQMEMQVRQPYLYNKHRSKWEGNLCDEREPGLIGESREMMCRTAVAYDKVIDERKEFIDLNGWYATASEIRGLKSLNWLLFLTVFAGIRLSKALHRYLDSPTSKEQ